MFNTFEENDNMYKDRGIWRRIWLIMSSRNSPTLINNIAELQCRRNVQCICIQICMHIFVLLKMLSNVFLLFHQIRIYCHIHYFTFNTVWAAKKHIPQLRTAFYTFLQINCTFSLTLLVMILSICPCKLYLRRVGIDANECVLHKYHCTFSQYFDQLGKQGNAILLKFWKEEI